MGKKFDKEKFSSILSEISTEYNNMTEFANAAKFDRSYISKYIHLKLSNPPSPKILQRIAESSKCITTYEDLMYMCGYTDTVPFGYGVVDHSIAVLTLFKSENGVLEHYNDLFVNKNLLIPNHAYFGFESDDDSMLPLLGKGDIAIIEKTDSYENGNTCLISLDNSIIFIRKILDFKEYIELHTVIPYNPPIRLTKDDMKNRNFKILGKVIKVENESAFK